MENNNRRRGRLRPSSSCFFKNKSTNLLVHAFVKRNFLISFLVLVFLVPQV
ncbi:hypothetical protein MYP_1767 [Sporocytophaga myxococcoides]|uniref:Uncharacterized protein n=1 Tax=Sporocytophaga myxococcoides TaxID=153721 RepID=A0A098LDM0_9BACT|nr:hypothetical protein MYP_1767 [Sporocytophaga myxococcoides]